MDERFSRQEMIMGCGIMERLGKSRVLICGVGGVGSYICEALARAGVGNMDLLDFDIVSKSNINRQLCALESTLGRKKAEVMAERLKDINPGLNVTVLDVFLSEDNTAGILKRGYDYIADAIDTVPSKLCLIKTAHEMGIPIISSMGTVNKLDTSAFEIADIYKTSVCPLARKVRSELKKAGIKKHTVLYSKEEPIKPLFTEDGRHTPGSVSFVPSAAGLMIAGKIIRDLAEI